MFSFYTLFWNNSIYVHVEIAILLITIDMHTYQEYVFQQLGILRKSFRNGIKRSREYQPFIPSPNESLG